MSAKISLWDLKPAEAGTIFRLDEKLLPKHRERLVDLGFAEGENVSCMRWLPFGGPRVFKIGDSVFSLDHEIALKVQVSLRNQR